MRDSHPDHPRACGANRFGIGALIGVSGSSPRMRGKHGRNPWCSFRVRIIPAHAGQTLRASSGSPQWSDHPRACGANSASFCPMEATSGSSPRMRGKHLLQLLHVGAGRIIPAHAGQTRLFDGVATSVPDHPRACGANYSVHRPHRIQDGSSPRMRGKPFGYDTDAKLHRIIPAHAGQTSGHPA